MKKKLIIGIIAAASVVAIAVTAFLGLFSASAETVLKTWNVANEFLDVIRESGDSKDNLKFKEFSYHPDAWEYDKIGPVKYNVDTYSYMASTHHQAWRAQIQIPNNQGVGEGKNIQGIYLYGSTTETQKITFTAPVKGKYNFVPMALGGSQEVSESIEGCNGSMKVNILQNGTSLMDEMLIAKGEKKNLPKLSGLMLNAGQTIEITFAGTALNDADPGNCVAVNFKIEIVNEYVPEVSNELVEIHNLANALAVENEKADYPALTGLITSGYLTGAVAATGSKMVPASKQACRKPVAGTTDFYTWYYGTFGEDSDYGMKVYPATDVIKIGSKNMATQGIIITADKDGKYILTADKVEKGGAGAAFFRVEGPGKDPYQTGGTDADGFTFEVDLKKGEKIYAYMARTNSDWQTGNMTITGLSLKIVTPPRKVTPAVYDITEYNVSEELRNNSGDWDTAYQDPTTYTRDGFLKPVAVGFPYKNDKGEPVVTEHSISDAWCRLYANYDAFSHANQSYDNNTMRANADGSMQWIYDYGDKRIGFKFKADTDAIFELSMNQFSKGGIEIYVYDIDGTEPVLIGNAVPVRTTKDFSMDIEVKKDKNYAIVLGKSTAKWGAKCDCTTASMTLKKKVLVEEEKVEIYPIIYTPDPNYVMKYKVEEMEMGLTSASVSAGDTVELTLDVNKTKFGFSGFVISVPYDSDKLELLSVEKGNIITKFGAEPLTDKNPLILTFGQADNVTSIGSVAKLKFKVKDNVSAGDITITPVVNGMVSSYNPGEVLDTTANVTVSAGTITVQ